ncbi:GNAT family N-acetyltransferase [Vibrio sp. S12_S33]|uniref:GNAT family N-acetyltransferase n=1 Tax=Vibrio sp. S12_S33 TaxID=2720223 RepID=UPI0017876DB2|nr:GNAT family N-acetyltransferase [Vibrio sp. S12_S33]MBD1567068.1 GNAT family N-acetyltransferase [Vibrio sp. S12_S33]
MNITYRSATSEDYQFTFELKKVAEMDSITAVFGWDEELQQELHRQEWNSGLPTIICLDGKPIGTYLLESKHDTLFFSRFFILPVFQGMGIGSQILQTIIKVSQQTHSPCKLCYLQGNRVGKLYKRFGFIDYETDDAFVHMQFVPRFTTQIDTQN